jgi:hypothetical protein
VNLFNVYMCNNYHEKQECWNSLLEFQDSDFASNCIFVGDFNMTLQKNEKKGGSIFRDPCREWMEDLMQSLNLLDIHPSKGHYT